ncbi:Peptidase family M28 [Algoriphagus alkaliphilus]|uniref:Peptidase family M28 n=1 Tax=Algoriphagus alkaliphilus TaxID=279824 RepID=A0A1G5Y001_9BACT|nr:M28 family peptidase [Algoriphagus alkaliphilus]MBA4300653.1 glutamine cyclotransferase [Cyclobacterium sp.]SDA76013.1 Peptidase family M28 [Algoriphagus alkaliphilus]
MKNRFWLIGLLVFGWACNGEKTTETAVEGIITRPYPTFNADSAYAFVQKQVDFGPRVPGTKGHAATKNWIISKLKSYGWSVQTQEFQIKTYDGLNWDLTNIIASYNPAATKRILLAAHWDTRRIADKDTERLNEPIDGANDGGSGVGVLIEIARTIATQELKPDVGIDIIFFDGEDDGEPEGAKTRNTTQEFWWCHGSQYWSKNKHVPNYSAYYGILVDLVGAKNAKFYREGYSRQYASGILSKVWGHAAKLGHSDFFIQKDAPPIIDDHVFVNEWGGIPMIVIIEFSPDYGFGHYHHTHRDNMDLIDVRSLRAVGETVLFTVYQE